ncbi:MAG TPA: hypothetical protein VGF93_16350 [Solirubrobacteraceae bacterium]|jgi:hypothetical protein
MTALLALHKIAVVQGRVDPRGQAFLARKQREGKIRREALRALNRDLVRHIFNLLRRLSSKGPAQHATAAQG